MNRDKTRDLTMAGLMAALVFVVTRFIQIPIPLGYFNVGNSVILLLILLVKGPYGVVASALGSGLADLLSYPIYTIPTVMIKTLMPIVYGLIVKALGRSRKSVLIAAAVSTLIPLFGYTITGAIIYGSLLTGIAQFPGLFVEYLANLAIIGVLYGPVSSIEKLIR